MSRLARYPLPVPAGVQISCSGTICKVQKGADELTVPVHSSVEVSISADAIQIKPASSTEANSALLGTAFALIRNAIVGITEGYEKRLLLQGVGYRAALSGQKLELAVGYSNPMYYEVPEGVSVSVPSNTEIILQSADKQLLGQVAAQIRAIRKPDAYKGKGIRYSDEVLKLKEVTKKK